MQFRDIVGQEKVKERLVQTVLENRVSHAQLFLGPEGSGSLLLALAYAQFISCENRQEDDSCGECASCRKYSKLIHPDLHFSYPFFRGGEKEDFTPDLEEWRDILLTDPYFNMDRWRERLAAQNKQPNINKAECLNILRKLALKPFESEYKTLVIWLPEYLKNEGNRLLKTLEEPSNKTLIILVAQNQDQILNTIISRTQLVKIPALSNNTIKQYLIESKNVSENKASQIAYLSEGNLQLALSFLQGEENDNFKLFTDWMRITFTDQGSKIIDFVEVIAKLGRENQKNFLCYGINLIRESVMILSGASNLVHLPDEELNFISNFSKQLTIAKAEAIVKELEKTHYHVERNANPKILFLDVSLQLIKILKFNMLPAGLNIYLLNMGCGSCSTGGCAPAGCKSNGSCLTNGCSKLDVYDWLSHMDMPANYKPFNIVEVKFKGSRKEFFVNTENIYLEAGELVALESGTGGYDIGHVSLTGELVRMQLKKRNIRTDDVVKKIYRKATPVEVDKWKIAKESEFELMHKSRVLAKELGLGMKLSDVDYQGDKSKATFYYTAESRVDFRELIKRMAERFRIRIEMRQIGMRQEASRLGGIGSCGRELCCSTWLTDFKTVSTSAARYQNLSLNTLKLAGQCGKLKCCLNYELDTYMDALKHIPNNVDYLETTIGTARLQKTDIFKKLMWFSYPNEENWIPLEISRVKEIRELNREGIKPNDLKEEAVELNKPVIAKVLDYENVVGQGSLTRLDNNKRTKKKKKNNNNRNKQRNQNGVISNVTAINSQNGSRPASTSGLNKNNTNRQKPGE